jgi:hypothetical protein
MPFAIMTSAQGGVMKAALLIGIAAFTVACDGSRPARTDTSAHATGAESPGAKASAAATSATSHTAVTVEGCLQASNLSGATGTAGTTAGDRASAPSASIEATERKSHGAQTGSFILTNAAVASSATHANGAGASGGAVVTTGSSFELDGLPADARASVNKWVRVTGRLDPRSVTAVPSTTGETSTRDDVRANSTGVAGDATNHRLTVETVQIVAPQCGPT